MRPLNIDYENHFGQNGLTVIGYLKYCACIFALNPKRRLVNVDDLESPLQRLALKMVKSNIDFYNSLYDKRQEELSV